MTQLRLEEIARVALIAAIAGGAAVCVFLAPMLVRSGDDGGVGVLEPGSMLVLLLMMGMVWSYTFVAAIVSGALLHLMLRQHRVNRPLVLLLFATVGASVHQYFFGNIVDVFEFENSNHKVFFFVCASF